MNIKIFLLIILILTTNTLYAQSEGKGTDFLYAKRLFEDAMFDLAAVQFHEYSEKYPESPYAPEALLSAGESYFQLKKYEAARKEYIYLIISYPKAKKNDEAQFKIGETYRLSNDFIKAAEAYKHVKIFYPKGKWAKRAIIESAKMYRNVEEYDLALEIFYDYLEDYRGSPQILTVHLMLAKTLMQKDDNKRALLEISKILGKTKTGAINSQALLLHGEIKYYQDKIDEAENIFNLIIKTYGKKSKEYGIVLAETYIKLAIIYRNRANYTRSNTFLSLPQIQNLPDNKITEAGIIKGDNFYDLQEYTAAINQYETVVDSGNVNLILRIGSVYEKLNDFQNAVLNYKKVIELCGGKKDNDNVQVCERCYLAIIKSYLKLDNAEYALIYLKKFKQNFPNSGCLDKVCFKIASIYETQMLEYERAIRLYYDFIDEYFNSLYVDDAQLGLGRCYEKLTNYSQALKEYQKFLLRYPTSDKAEYVEKRVTYLKRYNLITSTAAMSNFALLIGEAINSPERDKLSLKLAKTYYNDLKDYNSAKSIFQNLYYSQSNSLAKDELLYYLANSNKFIAEYEFYRNGIKSALLDTALNNYLQLLEKFPQSEWRDDATLELLKNQVDKANSQEHKNKMLKGMLDAFILNYPTSPFLDYVYFQMGVMLSQEDSEYSNDSLTVYDYFEKVQTDFPQSKYADPALLHYSQMLYDQGDKSGAQTKLSQYLVEFPNSKNVARVHFLVAKIFIEKEEYDSGLYHLNEIVTKYFYSNYANNANLEIGRIYFISKKNDLGLKHFKDLENILQQPCNWQDSESTNYNSNIIFNLGRFYQKSKDKYQAVKYYRDFIKEYPKNSNVPQVLYNLAELHLTNNSDDQEIALSYLMQLTNNYPEFEKKYDVNKYSGDLYLKKKQYYNARSYYLKTVEYAVTDVDKLYPAAQAIICLHSTGKIKQGDAEAKNFKKSFKGVEGKDEYLGQIEIAKGDYYFENKDFKLAEDTYKSIKSKFKKTDYGPKAAYSLGRLYLTLNKDEDALEILTEMPKKYADDAVIPNVYLALGDFYYFKSRQAEHAMLAYKNAVENPKITEESLQRGMTLLIKCYFDLRMWDQALRLSKQYIEKFPLAHNTFDLRVQIGIIYLYLKEYDRAVAYLKELKYEADRESEPRIQYWIGDCYMEKGQYNKALSEYLKVKYLSKPSKFDWAISSQYKAGEAYMKLGKMKDAKMIFQKIIDERGLGSNFGKGAQKKILEIESIRN